MNSYHKKESTMEKTNRYLGVDVAKRALQVDTFDKQPSVVENTSQGIAALIRRIKAAGDITVCCEATGGYERLLVKACTNAGIPVAVTNPRWVRDYARSKGILAKTDKIDARVLSQFGQQNHPLLLRVPEQHISELKELLVRRSELVNDRTREKCRMDTAASPSLIKNIKKHIAFFDKTIKELEALVMDMAKNNSHIQDNYQRLIQVKSIGPITALSIIAFMPELGRITNQQAAALAGLAPYNRDSGKFRGKRQIRGGRWYIRKVLFMTAVCASRTNDILKRHYQQLIKRGKPAKVALVAVMRKLIVLANNIISKPDFVPA